MSLETSLESVSATFLASVRSVGTACTLAVVGIYLHRSGFVVGDGKRTLALISQQVTIPLFLFTKIVFCNQDWSNNPCPDITQSLQDVWLLLFWPAYVVAAGLAVGYLVTKVTKTPPQQVRAVLACCAFGNSTGLPITLLTVVHANFPETSDLGRIDPTLFLSVYLLLYPVLQWGVGGWLLAPEGGDETTTTTTTTSSGPEKIEHSDRDLEIPMANSNSNAGSNGMDDPATMTSSYGLAHNVLNNVATESLYNRSRRGLSETDASLYMSVQEDLNMWDPATNNVNGNNASSMIRSHYPFPPSVLAPPKTPALLLQQQVSVEEEQQYSTQTTIPLAGFTSPSDPSDIPKDPPITDESSALLHPASSDAMLVASTRSVAVYHQETLWDTLQKIGSRCLQPPVVGAICGMMVAATPLRGIFVDLVDRRSHAPLQWLFDGLYQVGQAAVPINMMILGCNLSASYMQQRNAKQNDVAAQSQSKLLDSSTMMGVVIGKMLILPIVGFLSTYLLRESQLLNVPKDIDGSFYLVLMIVFLTPTANNVMVMVELSGSGTKEGIAQSIAWQYMSAPFMLSLTMSLAVGMASHWGA
jgi:predicted permease